MIRLRQQGERYEVLKGDEVVGTAALRRRIGPGAMELECEVRPAVEVATLTTLISLAFSMPDVDRVQFWHDESRPDRGMVPEMLGFTQVARHQPSRFPPASGEVGVDIVWELSRFQ